MQTNLTDMSTRAEMKLDPVRDKKEWVEHVRRRLHCSRMMDDVSDEKVAEHLREGIKTFRAMIEEYELRHRKCVRY